MSGESGMGGIPGLTEAEREALVLAMCAPDPERAPVTEIQLLYLVTAVARIKADAVAAALAPVERLADEWEVDYPSPLAACTRESDEWWIDLRAALAEGKGVSESSLDVTEPSVSPTDAALAEGKGGDRG